MMKKVQEMLIDDLDGSPAVATVKFTYKGKTYEIDLNEKNIDKFDSCITPFIDKARVYGRKRTEQQEQPDIRSWAKNKGLKIGSRGRIPATVLREYYKASA